MKCEEDDLADLGRSAGDREGLFPLEGQREEFDQVDAHRRRKANGQYEFLAISGRLATTARIRRRVREPSTFPPRPSWSGARPRGGSARSGRGPGSPDIPRREGEGPACQSA